jgi:cytochrome c oxidase subunit 2
MPRMSHTAVIITVAYTIAVVLGSAISFAVFRSTARPLEEDRAGLWSRRETTWLVVMIVTLFALLMGTIFYVPYGDTAGPRGQVVRVTGVQYAWAIDAPQPIVTGRPVAFYARSRDVAHGFGVYNPKGTLIFQAQVVPDHEQKIVHTFTEPGAYRVRCLEFCGAGHHLMESSFVVKPA